MATTPLITLYVSMGTACLSYYLTNRLIPRLGPAFISRGLKGVDMLKVQSKGGTNGKISSKKSPEALQELQECTGIIGAIVYILLITTFIPLIYQQYLIPPISGTSSPYTWVKYLFPSQNDFAVLHNEMNEGFPHHSLSEYLASLLSLLFATCLGFLDDVFDIRWRYKLPIPIIASIPLLVVYFSGGGITNVVIPHIFGLHRIFNIKPGGLLNLGPLYYLYMSMLSTFCTNGINILAGINGVEASQSLIIALSIVINDILYIPIDLGKFGALDFGCSHGSKQLVERHLFSLYFMLPLVGTSAAILEHNWYPARSFVGDTLCYFAGMAFAVVGILGHFSKTLLLFFLPQIFNFVLSTPQLFRFVPCPRHRLPRLNGQTGLLEPSMVHLEQKPNKLTRIILYMLELSRCIEVRRSRDRTPLSCTNLTLINMILVLRGPLHEETLTCWVAGVQICGSLLGFYVRYQLPGLFFDTATRR